MTDPKTEYQLLKERIDIQTESRDTAQSHALLLQNVTECLDKLEIDTTSLNALWNQAKIKHEEATKRLDETNLQLQQFNKTIHAQEIQVQLPADGPGASSMDLKDVCLSITKNSSLRNRLQSYLA